MRWTDNSMGSKQLLEIPDVQRMMGAGKLGMYLAAPDNVPTLVKQFQGKYEEWAMAPMPGQDGAAKGTLGGGEGYFFRKDLTPEQVKAGLKWIAFEKLTPGKGEYGLSRRLTINNVIALAKGPRRKSATESVTSENRRFERIEPTSDSHPRVTNNSKRTAPTISITIWSSSSRIASIMRSYRQIALDQRAFRDPDFLEHHIRTTSNAA